MNFNQCRNDGAFGPIVQGCRSNFDFTQKFERIFFWIVPSSVFILLATARLCYVLGESRKIKDVRLQITKTVIASIFAALQLVLLCLVSAVDSIALQNLSISGTALVFVSSLYMILVSYQDHIKSNRPSVLLNTYLPLTLLLDIAHVRTLWLVASNNYGVMFARIFTASIAVKLAFLLVEGFTKSGPVKFSDKGHSPEEASGIYSLAVYYWLRQLFWKGFRSVLRMVDLYGLDMALTAEATAPRLIGLINYRREQGRKLSLLGDFLRSLRWNLYLPIAPRVALIGFNYSQSFLLQALLNYLSLDNQTSDGNSGYGLIGASALVYIGVALSTSFYGYFNQRVSCMARASLCAAIFQKTTEIELTAASSAASVTLMSNDVEHIESGLKVMHELWGALVEVGLGCWLLETKLGAAFATPIVIIIICTALLSYAMTFVAARQTFWMENIQKRVAVTANAISKMKYFKMLGMTDLLTNIIQELRIDEIRAGNKFRIILLAAVALSFIPTSLSPAITFAVTFKELDASVLFVSLSFIMLLSNPLTNLFQSLPVCLAALASFKRIETYLAEDSRKDFRRTDPVWGADTQDSSNTTSAAISEHGKDYENSSDLNSTPAATTQPAFRLIKASYSWEENKHVLKDLDISIPRGKLTMLVGPVASGKSTLCQALLGEVPIASGETIRSFKGNQIGYSAQRPFLSDATIKANIIGYSPFNQVRYDAVVNATMLQEDIADMPSGHETKIGDGGSMLSGGQKQRVSLARALYLEAELLILDDVLSGLDANTESKVFQRVFGPDGLIRRRNITAILCTHLKRNFASADHLIVLGPDGRLAGEGPPSLLSEPDSSVSKSEIDEHVIEEQTDPALGEPLETKTALATDPEPQLNVLEGKGRGVADYSVYLHYVGNIDKLSGVAMILMCALLGFSGNFSTVWMSYWSDDSYNRSKGFYIGIYGLLRVMNIFAIVSAAAVVMFGMVSSSGSNLHKRAITTVMQAPLGLLSAAGTGVIINLFSQDMNLIDGELPMALLNASILIFDMLGGAFVIAVASPYLAITYPFIIGILFAVQLFYLRTSKQLRLLDLEAKSPLYAHYLETVQGLASIRAFDWEKDYIDKNTLLLNSSQRPAYLLAMVQQWLTTTLILFVGLVAVIVTVLATQLHTSTGFTGASLVTLMSFARTISNLMQSYTLLETSVGAISRLRTFSEKVPAEDADDDALVQLPASWPANGSIELAGVSASYSFGSPSQTTNGKTDLALRDLSLSIAPKQKVALCGRTGSGKSSVLLLLLRLLKPAPSESSIMNIDGIDIRRINRTSLRQRIVAIPQEVAFLPTGTTIKQNLDPFGEATDEECVSVLESLQLSDYLLSCGGLGGDLDPEKLSMGQKHIFVLAIAVLRRRVAQKKSMMAGGILLIDELNSKLDSETDRLIQNVIATEFIDYTVIMVSHRLETVMSFCDQVFILENGQVVESGSPNALLETDASRFKKLWNSDT